MSNNFKNQVNGISLEYFKTEKIKIQLLQNEFDLMSNFHTDHLHIP